jgi:hypothetical protein
MAVEKQNHLKSVAIPVSYRSIFAASEKVMSASDEAKISY